MQRRGLVASQLEPRRPGRSRDGPAVCGPFLLRRKSPRRHPLPLLPCFRRGRRDHRVLHPGARHQVRRRHLPQEHRPRGGGDPDLFGVQDIRHRCVEAEADVGHRRRRCEGLAHADGPESQIHVVGLDRRHRLQVQRRELRGREGRDRWRVDGLADCAPGHGAEAGAVEVQFAVERGEGRRGFAVGRRGGVRSGRRSGSRGSCFGDRGLERRARRSRVFRRSIIGSSSSSSSSGSSSGSRGHRLHCRVVSDLLRGWDPLLDRGAQLGGLDDVLFH